MFNYFIWMCFILLQGLDSLFGCEQYRNKIPNGNRIPHPCQNTTIWDCVGHQESTGNSQLNPFGVDFKSSGFKWTKELCEKDSDGDGLTNGFELGDPNCTWIGGAIQNADFNLSHPGICQPINDPKCEMKQKWLMKVCISSEFKCKAIHKPGTEKLTMQFPLMSVPTQDTSLVCKEFDLRFIEDAHIIAAKIILSNVNVIHHSLLFGCQTTGNKIRSDVYQCDMSTNQDCLTMMYAWGMGGKTSDCFNEHSGFRIGRKGFQKVILQFHLNNPTLRSDYMVAPALQMYYTTRKRRYDSGFFTIGSAYFEIPPKSPLTTVVGKCPGHGGSIEIIRNGTKIRDITRDNYNNRLTQYFETPIEVLPGDSLKITCFYNTMNRTNVTYFGNSTTESEMCLGFLSYYPKSNFLISYCVSYKSMWPCNVL